MKTTPILRSGAVESCVTLLADQQLAPRCGLVVPFEAKRQFSPAPAPTAKDDIKAVHRKVRSLFEREKRNGFRSRAIEEAATDAVLSFEAFVNNPHRPDIKEWVKRGVQNLEWALKQ